MQRSIILQGEAITPVNSTTYVDLAGLYAGLERFPEETSDEFLQRVQRAASLDRRATYEGLLNQLNLNFGLEPKELFTVSDISGSFTLSATIRGIFLNSRLESVFIPTREVDADNFWRWRLASEIVEDINATRTFQALLNNEAPAVQIVAQDNLRQIRNKAVTGTMLVMPEPLVDTDSILFNVGVPNYVFSENQQALLFDTPVREGTTISYRHRLNPYAVIGYPASVLSLSDPGLKEVALGPNGALIYQLREYLHRVAEKDRSYWGK